MIVLHVLILVGLLYYFSSGVDKGDRVLYWFAWFFRLLMSVALGLIYTYYYNANDTWHFFEDATKLSAVARTNFVAYLILTLFKLCFMLRSDRFSW
jgi:hypothetical protein